MGQEEHIANVLTALPAFHFCFVNTSTTLFESMTL